MASRFKTFSPNSTLPAADINDCLNPATADHIARAQAAGSQSVTVPANGSTDYVIDLPAGRFTTWPYVQLTGAGAQAVNCICTVYTVTATKLTIRIKSLVSSSSMFTVYWLATQI